MERDHTFKVDLQVCAVSFKLVITTGLLKCLNAAKDNTITQIQAKLLYQGCVKKCSLNYLDTETAIASETLKLKLRISAAVKHYQSKRKLTNASFKSSIGLLN